MLSSIGVPSSSIDCRQPVAIVGVEMRVRGVPLALEVRPIAAGPEPVAQRRHRVRRQPEHVVAVGALGDPVGLRHTVQRRILAGEQRRAARRARRRHRIVMAERHPVLPQPLHPGQMLSPERGELVGLIRRRVPLLIGQDDQHVRATSHTAILTTRAPPCASPGSDDAGPCRLQGRVALRGRDVEPELEVVEQRDEVVQRLLVALDRGVRRRRSASGSGETPRMISSRWVAVDASRARARRPRLPSGG